MGMYTEVFFRAEVDGEAFQIIRDVIEGHELPERGHPFFSRPRASAVINGASFYHPHAYHSTAEDAGLGMGKYVSFRSSLKNYSGEVEAFFDWVTPHVVNSGAPGPIFIGYSLYESATEPTLYYTKEQ